jgi:hypothetical protein
VNRRTALLLVVLVGVVAAFGTLALVARNRSSAAAETANGTGLTYQGRFYWASGLEVAPEHLGAPVADAIAFQDTTADLRSVEGFDSEVALAALLPSLTGAAGGPRWTFVSTDIDRGTNPAGYPDSSAVLVPAR